MLEPSARTLALLMHTTVGNRRYTKWIHSFALQDSDGDTALHLACREQRADTCTMLVEAGAKPGIYNHMMFNCLHIAAKNGLTRCVTESGIGYWLNMLLNIAVWPRGSVCC